MPRPSSLLLLRATLAVVFLWFGLLKVAGASPVGELVAAILPAHPATMPALGALEAVIGLGFLVGAWPRAVLAVFLAQMAGTLSLLALRADLCFQHGNPLLLTTVGEFVVKNLVLIAAGICVISATSAPRAATPTKTSRRYREQAASELVIVAPAEAG